MYKKRNIKSLSMKQGSIVSIMDIMFIITFFLLMNANFIEIRHIISEAPVFSELNNTKTDKKPLNLTAFIGLENVRIQRGIGSEKRTIASLKFSDQDFLSKLQDVFIQTKVEFPYENSLIIVSEANVEYDSIVKVVDRGQMIAKNHSTPIITIKDEQGNLKQTRNLFEMVMFQ